MSLENQLNIPGSKVKNVNRLSKIKLEFSLIYLKDFLKKKPKKSKPNI
jgi:hypothetical protein